MLQVSGEAGVPDTEGKGKLLVGPRALNTISSKADITEKSPHFPPSGAQRGSVLSPCPDTTMAPAFTQKIPAHSTHPSLSVQNRVLISRH